MITLGNYSFQISLVENVSFEKDANSTGDNNGCNNIPEGVQQSVGSPNFPIPATQNGKCSLVLARALLNASPFVTIYMEKSCYHF